MKQSYLLDSLLQSDLKMRVAIPIENPQQSLNCNIGPLPSLAYLAEQQQQQLLQKCLSLLQTLHQQSILPVIFADLIQSQLIDQLILHPELRGFVKYHFLLASLYLKRYIRVYFIDKQGNLLSHMYNFGFQNGYQLAICSDGMYYPVLPYSQGICHLKVHQIVSTICLEDCAQQCKSLSKSLNQYDQYKKKHKKSMSDNSMLDAFSCQRGLFLKIQHNDGGETAAMTDDGDNQHVCGTVKLIQQATPQSLIGRDPNQSILMMPMLSLSIEENEQRKCTGRLKFFDQSKNYGFIVMDQDNSDIFVHFDDILKAGISKQILRGAKGGQIIRLQFTCMNYIGKYKESRKAVDLILLQTMNY